MLRQTSYVATKFVDKTLKNRLKLEYERHLKKNAGRSVRTPKSVRFLGSCVR